MSPVVVNYIKIALSMYPVCAFTLNSHWQGMDTYCIFIHTWKRPYSNLRMSDSNWFNFLSFYAARNDIQIRPTVWCMMALQKHFSAFILCFFVKRLCAQFWFQWFFLNQSNYHKATALLLCLHFRTKYILNLEFLHLFAYICNMTFLYITHNFFFLISLVTAELDRIPADHLESWINLPCIYSTCFPPCCHIWNKGIISLGVIGEKKKSS